MDIKPAADIETYRAFSEEVLAEVEGLKPGATAARFDGFACEERRGFDEPGRAAGFTCQTSDQRRLMAERKYLHQRSIPDQSSSSSAPSAIFVALPQADRFVKDGAAPDGSRQKQTVDKSFTKSTGQTNSGGQVTDHNAHSDIRNGGSDGGDTDGGWRSLDVEEGGQDKAKASALVGSENRKSEINDIVSAATGAPPVSYRDGVEEKGVASGGKWRSPTNSYDNYRDVLTSAR